MLRISVVDSSSTSSHIHFPLDTHSTALRQEGQLLQLRLLDPSVAQCPDALEAKT